MSFALKVIILYKKIYIKYMMKNQIDVLIDYKSAQEKKIIVELEQNTSRLMELD